MNMENRNFWVRLAYCIATVVIAIYAIRGFSTSSSTSERVTASLKLMEEGLNELRPKIFNVSWLDITSGVSCESPPSGLKIFFINFSRLSIQVHGKPKFEVYIGETKINVPVSFAPPIRGGRVIFAPGEALIAKTEDKDTFKNYLSISKPDDRLPLKFVFEVKFSRINDDDNMFRYWREQVIRFDCSNLTEFIQGEIDENIEPINESSL